MFFTKTGAALGLIAGTSIGIYAGVYNFNPDNNQSSAMDEGMRDIAELLNQMSNAIDFGTSFALVGAALGWILDFSNFYLQPNLQNAPAPAHNMAP